MKRVHKFCSSADISGVPSAGSEIHPYKLSRIISPRYAVLSLSLSLSLSLVAHAGSFPQLTIEQIIEQFDAIK